MRRLVVALLRTASPAFLSSVQRDTDHTGADKTAEEDHVSDLAPVPVTLNPG
jgi:hypothetical protein